MPRLRTARTVGRRPRTKKTERISREHPARRRPPSTISQATPALFTPSRPTSSFNVDVPRRSATSRDGNPSGRPSGLDPSPSSPTPRRHSRLTATRAPSVMHSRLSPANSHSRATSTWARRPLRARPDRPSRSLVGVRCSEARSHLRPSLLLVKRPRSSTRLTSYLRYSLSRCVSDSPSRAS